MSDPNPHASPALTAAALTAFVLAARRRAGQTRAALEKSIGSPARAAPVDRPGAGAEKIPLALRVRGPWGVQ